MTDEHNYTRLPKIDELAQHNIILNTAGSNRLASNECQINAKNDYQAILCWLAEYKSNTGTYRVYQREVERFYLWCIYHQKKALSNCKRADYEAYFEFIKNPTPADIWCAKQGGRGRTRGDEHCPHFVFFRTES